MADISYLWNNRAQFPIGSKAFFKAWAKRILLIDELYVRNRRRSKLVRQGATIATTAEIGIVKVDGKRAHLTIESFTSIGRVEFALHDEIQIGAYVCVNDGVKLLTASHDISTPTWEHVKASIVIEDYAWIATNAIILPGVTIGRGAVVGAGAVVSKSVAPGAIVAGNPAKEISKKRSAELEYNPCAFLAVNNAWLKG
jgi:acetyltransferase-like isoleucine patch superfamily enzyme